MPLPQSLRSLVPDAVRDDPRARALALASGLIPPRSMHSDAESDLLRRLAAGRRNAVEIGVYEGSSALVLVEALPVAAALTVVDPFKPGGVLRPGWRASGAATRRLLRRAAQRRGGPDVRVRAERSEDVAREWRAPVDLVFIDGDHAEAACRMDWDLWHRFVLPGGVVAIHDARLDTPGGGGWPGPTAVVDSLFRGSEAIPGWAIAEEADTVVAVERLP